MTVHDVFHEKHECCPGFFNSVIIHTSARIRTPKNRVDFKHFFCISPRYSYVSVDESKSTNASMMMMNSSNDIWLKTMDNHVSEWLKPETLAKSKLMQLDRLNVQLKMYETCKECENTDMFLPGRGSYTPQVIFLSLHPNPYDQRQERAFSEGNWVDLLTQKITTVLDAKQYYLMYVFPYYLGKNKDASDLAQKLFLPYAKERIRLLSPRLVVSLGSRAGKYLFAHFDAGKAGYSRRYTDIMYRTTLAGKSETMLLPGSRSTGLIASPHPFQLLQFLSPETKEVNPAFSQENVDRFDACFKFIDKVINANRVRGPKVFDPKTGHYKIDPLPAMVSGARSFYDPSNTVLKKKKKKKKPVEYQDSPKRPRNQPLIHDYIKNMRVISESESQEEQDKARQVQVASAEEYQSQKKRHKQDLEDEHKSPGKESICFF